MDVSMLYQISNCCEIRINDRIIMKFTLKVSCMVLLTTWKFQNKILKNETNIEQNNESFKEKEEKEEEKATGRSLGSWPGPMTQKNQHSLYFDFSSYPQKLV